MLPLFVQSLALVDQADRLSGDRLLAEIEVGDLAFGPQNVEAGSLGALGAFGEVFTGLLDGPPTLLLVLLELPGAGLEVSQPLLALGQLDLDFGRLMVGRQPAALDALDLLVELGKARFHLGKRGVDLLSLSAGLRQTASGGFVLGLGVVQFAIQRGPLLVQLGASLFGGRDGHSVLRQGIQGLLVFGRATVDEALPGGDLLLQPGHCALCGFDRPRHFLELRLNRPQLAPPRDQAGRDVPRPYDQRAVGIEQFASQCDVGQSGANRTRQQQGMGEPFDKPRSAQQASGQGGEAGLGFHEPIGPAEHAGAAFEIGGGSGFRGQGPGVRDSQIRWLGDFGFRISDFGFQLCRRLPPDLWSLAPDPFLVVEPHETHPPSQAVRFGLQVAQ